MKILRKDLIISSADDGGNRFYIETPSTREQFEFTPEEAYLLQELKRPYNEKVLLVKFNAKYHTSKTTEDIRQFISRLEKWGLLTEDGLPPADEKNDGQEENAGPVDRLNHWALFSPRILLDFTTRCFSFVRYFDFLLYILFVVAIFTAFFNLHHFQQDLSKISSKLPLFKHLVFTLFTLNLFSQLLKGCIARYFHLNTPSFGIMLAYGIIPRFDIWVDVTEQTPQQAKLWLTASSILARIFLFSAGILFWILTRPMDTDISVFSAALGLFSFFSLFFVINPFLNSDGYRLITLYYNISDIRKKALRAIRGYFFPTPEVVERYTDDRLALKIYGLLTILFIISVIGFVGFSISHWLEKYYRGLGVVVFFLIIIYLLLRFRHLAGEKKARHAGLPKKGVKKGVKTLWVRWVVLLVVIGICFLPYQYEPGGEAVVTPVLNQKIYSESKGIVEKVYFSGGEWLEKGTLIAEMQNYRQKKEVALTRLAIEKKKREIDLLISTPLKEEIELARQQLVTAQIKLAHSKEDYDRLEILYKAEAVSFVDYLDAKKKMELDQQTIIEKKANLLAVQHQVNPQKIEAEKIALAILKRDLAFYEEQLEKTKLIMPNSGKIITMNLKNWEKKFLDDGQFFAEIEDASRVQIEIQIPESDISHIDIGDRMIFRAQSLPGKNITGIIVIIYPVTEPTEVGMMIKVVSILPNANYILKTGMSGHAKIEGDKMLVIQAFTRALLRFFQIELWSWLP
jgi:putative peptide zinc metalloprotease protein